MADKAPGSQDHSDDSLAAMNDHLARFFQHADALLREWKQYGDSLRATMDTQVRELQDVVAQAVQDSGREAAARIDGHIEQAVRASIDNLRRELDEMARQARHTGGVALPAREDSDPARVVPVADDPPKHVGPWHSGLILLALTAANVVLAVLLLSGIRSCRGELRDTPAPIGSAVTIDAAASDARPSGSDAVGAAESSPDTAELCTTLAQGYDAQAGKSFIGAAAGSLCGDEKTALAVTQTLMSQLPAELDGTEPGDKPDAESKSDGDGADDKSDKKSGAKSEKKSGKTSGKSKKSSRDGKKRSKKADK